MNYLTLTAQDITMTTTQFTRVLGCKSIRPIEKIFAPQHQPVRMNWVVVTDENENRRLQMGWHADPAE